MNGLMPDQHAKYHENIRPVFGAGFVFTGFESIRLSIFHFCMTLDRPVSGVPHVLSVDLSLSVCMHACRYIEILLYEPTKPRKKYKQYASENTSTAAWGHFVASPAWWLPSADGHRPGCTGHQ